MNKTNKIPFRVIKQMLGELGYTNIEQISESEYKAINPLDQDIRKFVQVFAENEKDIIIKSVFNEDYMRKAIGNFKKYSIVAHLVNMGIDITIEDFNINGDIENIVNNVVDLKNKKDDEKFKELENELHKEIRELMKDYFSYSARYDRKRTFIKEMRKALLNFKSRHGEETDKKFKEKMNQALNEMEEEINN